MQGRFQMAVVVTGGWRSGTRQDAAREPPENEEGYPEPSMFGTLPAYGFYLRHVRNVSLRDVEVGSASPRSSTSSSRA